MAAITPAIPTLLPGKSVQLKISVKVADVWTEKIYAVTTKSLSEQAEKVQTNNQTDNGQASHIYGFVATTGRFEMHVDSADLPSFRAGQFYGAEWNATSADTVSGTMGLDTLERTANPNGGYTLSGQFSFTGTVVRDDDGGVVVTP